jgi:hypothetical protein
MVELHQVESLVQERLHQVEDAGPVACCENVEEMEIVVVAHHAQDPPHRVGRERSVGKGDDLVRQRERVPHSPVGLPGHQAERFVGSLHALPLQHLPHPGRDVQDPDPAKVEALTARKDGGGGLLDLLGLGGGEDEMHPGGGSSSTFRSAFQASRVSMWASSTM